MSKIYVVGVGMTAFGRHPERSTYDLVNDAVDQSLTDAGLEKSSIGAVYYSNATGGYLQGQSMVPGPIAMRRYGISGVPVYSVENACASGSSAFNLACIALQAGACDVALAVGVEKMVVDDKAKMFGVFDGAWDVSTVEQNRNTLLALGAGIEPPPGTTSPRPYSLFMDVYAAFARSHMRRFGTTQRQFAAVAAKNHQHSVHNPLSQYRKAYSVDEVLSAAPITYPLTVAMCSPISDGAAATLLCNEAGLARLASRGRAIRVLASVLQTGVERSADDPLKGAAHLAAKKAYEQAGVGPQDVDLAEVHDATAVGEILNAEALMLAPFGEAGAAAERGDFSIGGRVPINPSGGLESKGHPIGATGLGQVYELVMQLRGEAGPRQVQNARIAIQENGGGLYGIEEAVIAVTLFGRS